MTPDMGIEITAQGIRENQTVINFLRNFLIEEGAMALPEGCT
jgi:hypothetical protein